MSKTKYRGIETTFSDNLLEKSKVKKCDPVISNKFFFPSLYYDGMYFFYNEIEKISDEYWINQGCSYSIHVVYYSGKWIQDKHYITEEFRDFLMKFAPKPKDNKQEDKW